jgi:acyl carrier protein
MIISSRTPEGFPTRCTLCGTETNLEFSYPAGDAPCPSCGHLLWFSAKVFSSLQERLSELLGVAADRISPDSLIVELGADSLDVVELVMELEEEFDFDIPDDAASRMNTLGDLIRYIEERKRGLANPR